MFTGTTIIFVPPIKKNYKMDCGLTLIIIVVPLSSGHRWFWHYIKYYHKRNQLRHFFLFPLYSVGPPSATPAHHHTSTVYHCQQGRVQDLKKEGAQGVRGLACNSFFANLGDFLKNLALKAVGVRPLRTPPPSGSAPGQRLVGRFQGD